MNPTLLAELDALAARVRAGHTDDAAIRFAKLRSALIREGRERDSGREEAFRSRQLLERTLRVVGEDRLHPVAHELLDALLEIVGARRAFLGLVSGGGWTFEVARNLQRADLTDPAAQVSTTIIEQALATGQPVVTQDAMGDFGDASSVAMLALRSVLCLPIVHEGRMVGFVYLDDPERPRLFDAPAVTAATAWLPLVAGCLVRAMARESAGPLPGVITRSPRLLDVLAEVARIAKFDAPILLTGETGTGKSLIARSIHGVSHRAAGPFVHLNCGAIPEGLLEGELFGSEAGAFTGAKARRIGKLEAAAGGTVFLDELDAMPLSCQVKLLVALQERVITRLGGNAAIPIDVRVIAAMGADPFTAIAEGRLREDLYYRLAVCVARIPALRERPEDVPLLALHVLERSRTRYGLPALRLSPDAEAALLAHPWPGNVRELENVLDRAALLCKDGEIATIGIAAGRAREARGGVIGGLQLAAASLVDAMEAREALRDVELARAFEGALWLQLEARLGDRGAAFDYVGRSNEVKARNHNRTFAREVARLRELAALLGESVNEPG